jgi:hypothetical protein
MNIIANCLGLNTVLDPFQPVAREDGAKYLSKAVNVRITDSKVIERSEFPRTLLTLTSGHSLFCDGGACLVHQGGAMYEVATNLALSAAKRSGMSGDRLSQCQVGDAIYFSNLSENGVYYGGSAISWAVDAYVGPETNRYFVDHVPYFGKIAHFNGYMLGAIGNALYASELGRFGLWEMKPVWMSNSDILMVKPVEAGAFVSDRSRQFFLAGLEPKKFAERKVADYPAIEWSVAHGFADASEFSEASGLAAVWSSSRGKCVGFADGTFKNVTQQRIVVPAGFTSGATLIDGNNIISTLR